MLADTLLWVVLVSALTPDNPAPASNPAALGRLLPALATALAPTSPYFRYAAFRAKLQEEFRYQGLEGHIALIFRNVNTISNFNLTDDTSAIVVIIFDPSCIYKSCVNAW